MTPDLGSDSGGTGLAHLLRGLRRAAGLTQADLALRAGIGVRTVRDLERGRASRPQRTTVDLLAEALHLVGAERSEFVALARGTRIVEPSSSVPTGRPTTGRHPRSDGMPVSRPAAVAPVTARGLPPAGDLVGRERDTSEVVRMLAGTRRSGAGVVSLVGLAGVGKTALALAVAERIAERHPGGVAGIVVTGLSTESDVLSAVATVFGVGRPSELAARLADGPAMLLVDAVERAPGAVAEALYRLMVVAPTLRILTTGRHPVGLANEWVWPVTPLEMPPPGTPTELAAISDYPAVALFLARLRQVRREPPRPDEIDALLGLVRRVGGLPLAIELAAGRGRILDLKEILDRYGDRLLDLGTPLSLPPVVTRTTAPAPVVPSDPAIAGTLREALAASYRLIEPRDQVALRRLSAFRNRWSVELAETMLAEPDGAGRGTGIDPVPVLDRLMELGLISARGTGPVRFRMLDVVRDFAEDQAAAEGELIEVRRRHAVIFAQLAGRIRTELTGANLTGAVNRLDEVASDLWAALAHAANDDPHTALRLAASLPRWWRFRGRDVAGRQWLRRLLADPRTADAEPGIRAWAQVGLAQLAAEHDAGPQELPAVRAALAWFQSSGELAGELAARNMLSRLLIVSGEYDEARQHSEAVLDLAGRSGQVRDLAVAQNNLTWHEIRVGDLRAARRRLAAVDRLSAECGEDRLRVLARANLAEVVRLDGRYADAVEQGRRVIAMLADLGDPGHRRRVLGTVGLALAQVGRSDEASAVLDELRAWLASEYASTDRPDTWVTGSAPPASGATPRREEGVCALIEAILAVRRGSREYAAEWFGAAAQAYLRCGDLRDVVEALVGLVTTTDDPVVRAEEIDRLDQTCRDGGITLLPAERRVVDALRSAGASAGP